MAIDYSLIGRFNQVQPGGLTQAFRGGVDLRGQMLQNQAQQFNLQQAPILAERATQKWNQDLANLQAEEQKNIQEAALKEQEIKQKKLEADQKRYTDSMSILGRSLYSIDDESQIPIVLSSLKQMADNKVIDANVFYNIPGIKEGRLPTLQEAKVISNSLIETKDQLIKEREAAKAQAEAEQNKIQNTLKQKQFGLDEKKFNEMVRHNKQMESLAGQKQLLSDQKSLKSIPPKVKEDIASNITQSSIIDEAISLVSNNKKAVGVKYGVPGREFLGNISGTDEEKKARQLIGQVAGLKIKDISGAAVSAAEEPRLKRWIPFVSDPADVVISKLNNLKNEIARLNSERLKAYSPSMGYESVPGWENQSTETTVPEYLKGLSKEEIDEFNRLGGQ